MSASDKKKLRKEQAAAAMTEKQQSEKKEQKKLKAYTVTFVIAMILVVAIVLCAALQTPVKNAMSKNTVAVTVNDHQLNTVELSYFYVDALNNFYNQFSSAGDYQNMYVQIYTGLNPTASLDSQVYNSTTGETWADYFIDSAISNAEWTYAMYDAAMAENYSLTDDQKTELNYVGTYMDLYASLYGYSSTDSYMRALYGSGASLETYKEYYEVSLIASAFATDYYDSLEYTDADYREYEEDKYEEFCSYSYALGYINVSKYLTGGTTTTDEEGKTSITYSDEEKAAAVEAALADAKSLTEGGYETADKLTLAATRLKNTIDISEVTAALYSSLSISNEDVLEWITSEDRTSGELTYIEASTEDEDGNVTVNGYYVVLFLDRIDNASVNVGSVRHLLVAFEGGTEDDDGNVTYSDEEKAAAKEQAEKLLEEYLNGETVDEEAFTALIKEHSDDSEDGLYEDITPDSNYVENFRNWAVADHEVGDVEIIETEYGYHIMYYVGANELSYRDLLIDAAICEEAYSEWEEELVATVTTTDGNLKYMNRDFVLSAG